MENTVIQHAILKLGHGQQPQTFSKTPRTQDKTEKPQIK